MMNENKNIIVYQSGELEITVSVDKDTIRLSAEDIAKLFDVQRPAIVKHVGNIYKTNELDKVSTCSILEQVAKDGKKRKKTHYNLDMIIDRKSVYHFWASLKDVGKKWFAFSKLPMDANDILEKLD